MNLKNPCKDFDYHQAHIKSVTDILNENSFSFSAEIIPPRNGTDFDTVFELVSDLKQANFQFISVTHGAGGSLRGGTLPIAYHAQNNCELTSIAHLTCRGMSREDLENHLIDHHYFGVHNILALRGDSPDGIDAEFTAAEGGFSYAYELAGLIQNMNRGQYLARKNYDKGKQFREGIKTRFCIGVACYPEDAEDIRIAYLDKKVQAGASFAITQMIFDADIFESFYKQVVDHFGRNLPILPGIRIPSSYKQLERMNSKFGIAVPGKLMNAMREAKKVSPEKMVQVGHDWALEFAERIFRLGLPGMHIFIMGNTEPAVRLKNEFLNRHNTK